MVVTLMRHCTGPRHHMPSQLPAGSVHRALVAAASALPRGTAGTTGAAASPRTLTGTPPGPIAGSGTAASNAMTTVATNALSFATTQFSARPRRAGPESRNAFAYPVARASGGVAWRAVRPALRSVGAFSHRVLGRARWSSLPVLR